MGLWKPQKIYRMVTREFQLHSCFVEVKKPKNSPHTTMMLQGRLPGGIHMLRALLALGPRLVRMGGQHLGEDLVQETYISLRRSGASDASPRLVMCAARRKLV